MSTADVTGDGTPPPDDAVEDSSHRDPGVDETTAPARSRVPPRSPATAADWLLRTAAYAAVVAGVAGVVVAPGIRGIVSGGLVERVEGSSAALSYFLMVLLLALVLWGAIELVRAHGVGVLTRVVIIAGAAGVVCLSSPALRDHLPVGLSVLIAAATTAATIAAATTAARTPHTRAVGAVLFALSFAAIARLGGWGLATAAGERGSVDLYAVGRGLSTAAVIFESFAQLLAVVWLGTRSRLAGQLACSIALVGACAITWGVARGGQSGATILPALLHNALVDAPGLPHPYALDAVATFLVPASLLLALVASAQPGQLAVVASTMALALVSRGAFDAPLRALCAVAAAEWATLAYGDDRSMWRMLLDDRRRRAAEDGFTGLPHPPEA